MEFTKNYLEGLVTEHAFKVELWENGKGLQWDISVLPNGNFSRIMWGSKLKVGGDGRENYPTFWVDEATNIKWPKQREPDPSEVSSFALLALKQMPDPELVKEMVASATNWLRVRAQNLEKEAKIISDLLNTN